MNYGPGIEVRDGSFACGRCGHRLGTLASGYESGSLVVEAPLAELGQHVASTSRMKLSIYLCPECGQSLKVASTMTGDSVPPDRRTASDTRMGGR